MDAKIEFIIKICKDLKKKRGIYCTLICTLCQKTADMGVVLWFQIAKRLLNRQPPSTLLGGRNPLPAPIADSRPSPGFTRFCHRKAGSFFCCRTSQPPCGQHQGLLYLLLQLVRQVMEKVYPGQLLQPLDGNGLLTSYRILILRDITISLCAPSKSQWPNRPGSLPSAPP